MGVDFEVMVTSQKRRVTLPNGETVTVYGYRTCPRGESRPSSWLHECQNAQDAIVERASVGVDSNNPRYIVALGFGEIEKKGKRRRVFELEEGRLVRQVEDGRSCAVAWWDSNEPPNTKPIGFLKKVGNRWTIVTRYESRCNSTTLDDNGNSIARNCCVEYIDENGKYQQFSYWQDEASVHQAPSQLVAV